MIVGCLQFNPVFGEVERNLHEVAEILGETPVDLVVLPELFNTGYNFVSRREVEALAEPVPHGRSCQFLRELARGKRCYIAAGIAERETVASGRGAANAGACYNSAVLVGPGGVIARYRKLHLFDREKELFSPGNFPLRVVEIGIGEAFPVERFEQVREGDSAGRSERVMVGMMICFDWFFPEVARSLSLQGAELLLHPANLVLPHCPSAMLTRSLENRVYSLTANRTGREDRGGVSLRYIGSSQIVAPEGEILKRAGEEETTLLRAEVDPLRARDKRITPRNDLFKDRRREFYRGLIEEPS